ncbi:hypothetical protein ACQP2P_39745 [Dactylosporangium sp. CA-139114]|uniref:hypothetical protein n=1 Tax=Dactylosporangium sp. CA-139114 TaxID=3239931 RepID=UPI003D9697DC
MRARAERLAAAVLVAALAVTGCSDGAKPSSSSGAPATSSAAPVATDPASVFKAAVAKTNSVALSFTIDSDLGTLGQMQGDGASDPAKQATAYKAELLTPDRKIDISAVLVSPDLYLQVTGITTDRWAHLDVTKVKSLSKLGLDATGSPTGLGALPGEIVTVTRTGPGAFSGTLDKSKTPVAAGAGATEALKSVPFEATVDANGYVTQLVTHTPPLGTAPASSTTAKFANFGSGTIKIERPDSATVEQAPDSLYQTLQ